jgi:glutathione S-transferase
VPQIVRPASPIVPNLEGLHLFHFDGAPCAQRVRFALGEKGLARGREVRFDADNAVANRGEPGRWTSRIVSLVRKDHMTPAYAQIHPDLVVPALVHDGRLYLESLDIIEYLDDTFGGAPLLPPAGDLRQHTLDLANEARSLHVSLRYVTFRWGLGWLAKLNSGEQQKLRELVGQGADKENLAGFYDGFSNDRIPDAVFEEHLQRLLAAFRRLDATLQSGQAFLAGADLTLADAFWAMKVLRLRECGYPFAELHPAVAEWYGRMYARPSFRNEVMGRNHLTNRLFTAKASIERMLGIGLDPRVRALIRKEHEIHFMRRCCPSRGSCSVPTGRPTPPKMGTPTDPIPHFAACSGWISAATVGSVSLVNQRGI